MRIMDKNNIIRIKWILSIYIWSALMLLGGPSSDRHIWTSCNTKMFNWCYLNSLSILSSWAGAYVVFDWWLMFTLWLQVGERGIDLKDQKLLEDLYATEWRHRQRNPPEPRSRKETKTFHYFAVMFDRKRWLTLPWFLYAGVTVHCLYRLIKVGIIEWFSFDCDWLVTKLTILPASMQLNVFSTVCSTFSITGLEVASNSPKILDVWIVGEIPQIQKETEKWKQIGAKLRGKYTLFCKFYTLQCTHPKTSSNDIKIFMGGSLTLKHLQNAALVSVCCFSATSLA